MKSLANETYIPKVTVGKGKDAKEVPEQGCAGYEIKALTSLQLTEVISDGSDDLKFRNTFKFQDIQRILRLGMVDTSLIETMPSIHHVKVAYAIYNKANVAEEERKNS